LRRRYFSGAHAVFRSRAEHITDRPTSEEWRAVTIKNLHAFARAATERSSVQQVANEIGIGCASLRDFIAGETIPHRKKHRLIATWYLHQTGNIEVDSEMCDALLGEIAEDLRDVAVADLATFVRELHALYRPAGDSH
jgi:hypothetical protein